MYAECDEMKLAATDGLQLAATRWGTPTAPATVVYVHGFLEDSSIWAEVAQRVHERVEGGIAQLVYDQRGQGHSGNPSRRLTTTMRQLAEDLDTVLTYASGSIVLVAHSTGSLIVHAWAEHYPQRAAALSGLVVLNGGAEFPETPGLPRRYRRRAQQLRRWRHGPLESAATASASMLRRKLRRVSTGAATNLLSARCDARVLIDVLDALYRAALSEDTAQRLRTVPSFVLTGEHDRIVPPTQSIRLADRIWSELDIVPGGDHRLPCTSPDRVVDAILEVLEIVHHSKRIVSTGLSDDAEDLL
ncbi:alpha/beta fold hydrolase [Nocardia vaccinii]|uniref:alpha/beta fold hydrolase n=1 Tax=Nocardia vaccinii TaxID=1822 RepID=UPI0008314C4B|nr:alpha/beta hydrolase [Nocardia vaccinii]